MWTFETETWAVKQFLSCLDLIHGLIVLSIFVWFCPIQGIKGVASSEQSDIDLYNYTASVWT